MNGGNPLPPTLFKPATAPASVSPTTARRSGLKEAAGRWRRSRISTSARKAARVNDPPGVGARTPFLLLHDRTLLARPGFTFSLQTQPGIYRDSGLFVRYDPDGMFVDSAGRFMERELFVYQEGGNSLAGELPMGRQTHYAAAAEGFYVGSGAHYNVELHGGDGGLRAMVRADRPSRAVGADDVARLKEPEPGMSPADHAFWLRVLNGIQLPAQFPAYAGLTTGGDGYLWVRDYTYPPDSQPPTWQIFDREGRWPGGLEFPSRFRIMHIGADEIIGVWRDELTCSMCGPTA